MTIKNKDVYFHITYKLKIYPNEIICSKDYFIDNIHIQKFFG